MSFLCSKSLNDFPSRAASDPHNGLTGLQVTWPRTIYLTFSPANFSYPISPTVPCICWKHSPLWGLWNLIFQKHFFSQVSWDVILATISWPSYKTAVSLPTLFSPQHSLCFSFPFWNFPPLYLPTFDILYTYLLILISPQSRDLIVS